MSLLNTSAPYPRQVPHKTPRGVWIGANKLTLIAPTARVRTINGKAELIAPIDLKINDNTVLEAQLSW